MSSVGLRLDGRAVIVARMTASDRFRWKQGDELSVRAATEQERERAAEQLERRARDAGSESGRHR